MRPIALIVGSRTSHRLSLYLEEIMLTEGYNAYDIIDVSKEQPTKSMLAGRSLIVAAHSAADQLDWTILEKYVENGGALIAIKPPQETDYLFGLRRSPGPMYTRTVDRYLVFNRGSHLTLGIRPPMIQFIGEADLYTANGAESLAFITGAPDADGLNIYPGVAVSSYGSGQTAIFSYDLSACIVRLHQGNPALSSLGAHADPDADDKFTASELFKNQLDFHFRRIPQADVHQDLFVTVLKLLTNDRHPIPRLWHFPGGAPSVAFINGDSDSMKLEEYEQTLHTITQYGGKYTCYIMDNDQKEMPPDRVGSWIDSGHDFGPHLFCGTKPSLEEMKNEITRAVESFKKKYGFQPVSHRGHCIIWVGWTEMAEALHQAGIRLDTNFTAGVGKGDGFINGSGLPVKFMNESGEVLDIYEQSTQLADDGLMLPKMLLKVKSYDEIIAGSFEILNICMSYHSVFHPYYHPIHTGPRGLGTLPLIRQVMQGCAALGIPFVTGSEWIMFNDARRGIKYSYCNWDKVQGKLSFEISTHLSAKDMTILLPSISGKAGIGSVEINREKVPYSISNDLEGCPWAKISFDLHAGDTVSMNVLYK